MILALAFYVIGELPEFVGGGDVPTVGANPLYTAGVGGAGGGVVHDGFPVVKVAELMHSVRIPVGIVTIGFRVSEDFVGKRNGSAIGVSGGSQVLFHPALLADEYGMVHVSINIGDSGSSGTCLSEVFGNFLVLDTSDRHGVFLISISCDASCATVMNVKIVAL